MRLIEQIPLTLEGLKFIDWATASFAFSKEMNGIEDIEEEYEKSIKQINAVLVFCAELNPLFGSLPTALSIDEDLDYTQFAFSSSDDDTDLSLIRILWHVHNMVRRYESDLYIESKDPITNGTAKESAKELISRSFKFFHNGKTFVLKGKDAKEMENVYSLSANEVIEVLEYKRVAAMKSRAGDIEGDNHYNAFLQQLSVLCRPEGVDLPVDKTEREAFREANMTELQELSFQTIRDIDFFLIIILKQSLETLIAPFLQKVSQHSQRLGKKRSSRGLRKIGTNK
jgi:hypothetical protein